ncbi:hypothetical protein GYMLUDRAFT_61782 [Collybiopsis luxurians FD-317 M1]|uniref:Uncharacterized protein n=1 Tax=Collybiopsis luxurians FD-317 M1 TaxID=944289 RepID=A0A0D0BNV9_9AGAR|nr:hypothetical protein GYMLUDRAFT_61782 [Collybiopsis luxurians FD-317 M1]
MILKQYLWQLSVSGLALVPVERIKLDSIPVIVFFEYTIVIQLCKCPAAYSTLGLPKLSKVAANAISVIVYGNYTGSEVVPPQTYNYNTLNAFAVKMNQAVAGSGDNGADGPPGGDSDKASSVRGEQKGDDKADSGIKQGEKQNEDEIETSGSSKNL